MINELTKYPKIINIGFVALCLTKIDINILPSPSYYVVENNDNEETTPKGNIL
jgi:hypothetical protein